MSWARREMKVCVCIGEKFPYNERRVAGKILGKLVEHIKINSNKLDLV